MRLFNIFKLRQRVVTVIRDLGLIRNDKSVEMNYRCTCNEIYTGQDRLEVGPLLVEDVRSDCYCRMSVAKRQFAPYTTPVFHKVPLFNVLIKFC